MLNTFKFSLLAIIFGKQITTMFHLSQLQSSLLLLSMILLYHIVMLILFII